RPWAVGTLHAQPRNPEAGRALGPPVGPSARPHAEHAARRAAHAGPRQSGKARHAAGQSLATRSIRRLAAAGLLRVRREAGLDSLGIALLQKSIDVGLWPAQKGETL